MSHKPQEKGLELRMLVFKRGASKRKLTIPVAIIFVETLHTTQRTCLGTCMPSSKSDSWPGLVAKGRVKFFRGNSKLQKNCNKSSIFWGGRGGRGWLKRGASIC